MRLERPDAPPRHRDFRGRRTPAAVTGGRCRGPVRPTTNGAASPWAPTPASCSAASNRKSPARHAHAAVAEIERLEGALSLFRDRLGICRLNRDRRLHSPSGDLRRALALALAIADGERTACSIRPCRRCGRRMSTGSQRHPMPALPPEASIASSARSGRLAPDLGSGPTSIRLGAASASRSTVSARVMSPTGSRTCCVRAACSMCWSISASSARSAARADGAPWLVARAGAAPIALRDGALATSEGAGCVLGAAGAAHHLFDPRSGRSAAHWRRITVHHRSAARRRRTVDRALRRFGRRNRDAAAALSGTSMVCATTTDAERRWFSPPVDGPQAEIRSPQTALKPAGVASYFFLPSAPYCLRKAQRSSLRSRS